MIVVFMLRRMALLSNNLPNEQMFFFSLNCCSCTYSMTKVIIDTRWRCHVVGEKTHDLYRAMQMVIRLEKDNVPNLYIFGLSYCSQQRIKPIQNEAQFLFTFLFLKRNFVYFVNVDQMWLSVARLFAHNAAMRSTIGRNYEQDKKHKHTK